MIATGEKVKAMIGHQTASLPSIIDDLTLRTKTRLTNIATIIVLRLYIFIFLESKFLGDNLKKTNKENINKGISTIRVIIILFSLVHFQITWSRLTSIRRSVDSPVSRIRQKF